MGRKMIILAVLGTGSIGMRHVKVLSLLGAKVIAVPARPERAAELAEQGMISARSLEDAKRMGALGVVVATDTSRHVKDCLEACALDMPVLCEKPLAVSASQASELAAVDRSRILVGYTLRFDDGFRIAFDEAAGLGRPHFLVAECRSYLPSWRKGRDYRGNYCVKPGEGGVLLDLSHEVDYLNHFYGKPTNVSGLSRNLGSLGIAEEEIASAVMDYGERGFGVLTVDYLSRQTSRSLTVASEKGEMRYDFVGKVIQVFSGGDTRTIAVERDADTIYEREDGEFLDILEGGERKLLASTAEAVDALTVIDAWKKSSDSGTRVEIKYAS